MAFACPSAFAYEDGPSDPSASSAAPSAAVTPPRPTHWYGYETLATDGAALALAIPALAVQSNAGPQQGLGIASGLTYAFGGPIVHWSHGHVGKGFADLAMRLGLPVAVGFLGGIIGAATYRAPPGCDEKAHPATRVQPTVGLAPERAGGTRATLGLVATF